MLSKKQRKLLMKQEAWFDYEEKKYKLPGISFQEWWREHLPVKLPNKICLEVKWSGKPPMPTTFNILNEHPSCWYQAQEK